MNQPSLELGVEQKRTDRSASYIALSSLEAALEAPSTGRETAWLATIIDTLDSLITALDEQARRNRETDSLLSQIAFDQPRFEHQISSLEDELDTLAEMERSLRNQIAAQLAEHQIYVADQLPLSEHRVPPETIVPSRAKSSCRDAPDAATCDRPGLSRPSEPGGRV